MKIILAIRRGWMLEKKQFNPMIFLPIFPRRLPHHLHGGNQSPTTIKFLVKCLQHIYPMDLDVIIAQEYLLAATFVCSQLGNRYCFYPIIINIPGCLRLTSQNSFR